MNQSEKAAVAVADEARGGDERSIAGFHGVRYQTKDVQRAVAFYTTHLGFTLEHQKLPAFATVALGELKLLRALLVALQPLSDESGRPQNRRGIVFHDESAFSAGVEVGK